MTRTASEVSDLGWLAEPVGLIVVGLVTVVGSLLTTRASNRSSKHITEKTVAAQVESSRVVAEEHAFARAKGFYEGVIDRQDREKAEQDGEIRDLKAEVAGLKRQLGIQEITLGKCRAVCRQFARRLGEPEPDLEV